MDVLQKPVDEVGQGVVTQFLRKAGFEVAVPPNQILHRLRSVSEVEGLPLVKSFHCGGALVYVEVEGLLVKSLRED